MRDVTDVTTAIRRLRAGRSGVDAALAGTPAPKVLAWNACRLSNVAAWAYGACFLDRDDAWIHMVDAARALQLGYEGFGPVARAYLAGYRRDLSEDTAAVVRAVEELTSASGEWTRLDWNVALDDVPAPDEPVIEVVCDGRTSVEDAVVGSLARGVDPYLTTVRVVLEPGVHRAALAMEGALEIVARGGTATLQPRTAEHAVVRSVEPESAVRIVGVTIDAASRTSTGAAIEVEDGFVRLERVAVEASRLAVDLESPESFVHATDCTLGPARTALRVGAGLAVLRATTVRDTRASGVIVEGGGELFVRGCGIARVGTVGLRARGRVDVDGLDLTSCAYAGISLDGATRSKLRRCMIRGSFIGLHALRSAVRLFDVRVEEAKSAGLYLLESVAAVHDCSAARASHGITLVRASARFLRCSVLDCREAGAAITEGSVAWVEDSTFTRCGDSPFTVERGASCLLEDAVVQSGPLRVQGARVVARGVEISGSELGGVLSMGDLILDGCDLTDNRPVGVEAAAGATLLRRCKVDASGGTAALFACDGALLVAVGCDLRGGDNAVAECDDSRIVLHGTSLRARDDEPFVTAGAGTIEEVDAARAAEIAGRLDAGWSDEVRRRMEAADWARREASPSANPDTPGLDADPERDEEHDPQAPCEEVPPPPALAAPSAWVVAIGAIPSVAWIGSAERFAPLSLSDALHCLFERDAIGSAQARRALQERIEGRGSSRKASAEARDLAWAVLLAGCAERAGVLSTEEAWGRATDAARAAQRRFKSPAGFRRAYGWNDLPNDERQALAALGADSGSPLNRLAWHEDLTAPPRPPDPRPRVRVRPGESLRAALASAPAHAVVLLAPGEYSADHLELSRPVTLAGEEPGRAAILTVRDGLRVSASVTLQSMRIASEAAVGIAIHHFHVVLEDVHVVASRHGVTLTNLYTALRLSGSTVEARGAALTCLGNARFMIEKSTLAGAPAIFAATGSRGGMSDSTLSGGVVGSVGTDAPPAAKARRKRRVENLSTRRPKGIP